MVLNEFMAGEDIKKKVLSKIADDFLTKVQEIFFERMAEKVLVEDSPSRLEQASYVIQSKQVAPDLIEPSVEDAHVEPISILADEYVLQDFSFILSAQ